MKTYMYLSMIPESLVASMLPPEEFGTYLATGTRKRPHGAAMFFQINEGFTSDYFDLSDLPRRCVPHADAQPKHSVYLGIYRVLEHMPLEAIGSLYLVTAHGRVLELARGEALPGPSGKYHLYQEICPVHPLIASSLDPEGFCRLITDPTRPISVPRICFVDLQLSGLADDPAHAPSGDLPYHNIDHLRDCLVELGRGDAKQTKTVDRISRQSFLFRSVRGGFFLGDQERMLCFPYPSREQLEGQYYRWWRCANDAEIEQPVM